MNEQDYIQLKVGNNYEKEKKFNQNVSRYRIVAYR